MAASRRRFDRVAHGFDAQCRAIGRSGGSWCPMITDDLGAGGMSFQCLGTLPFPEEDRLEIRLKVPSVRAPLVLRARVLRARTRSSGATDYAVEFVDVTADQQVQLDEMVQFLRKKPGQPPPAA